MFLSGNRIRRFFASAVLLSFVLSSAPAVWAAPADAVELESGVAVSGKLDSAVDSDSYSITLTENGPVSIDLVSEGTLQAVLMKGDQVIYTQSGGERAAKVGLEAGEYQLRVSPRKYVSADYALTVDFAPSSGWETEFNDGPALADALPSGGVVYGSVMQPEDRDCFVFTLASKQYMALSFSADEVKRNGWMVSLYDGSGREVYAEVPDGSGATEKLELAAGQYRAEVTAADHSAAGYKLSISPLSEAQIVRLGGSTRIETAVEISRAGWENNGADAVVIANAYNFPDALAGETLAATLKAPILLTSGKNALEPELVEEIIRLGAKNAYILGGSSVVCENIADELSVLTEKVERLSGSDRYGTAVAIAREIYSLTGSISAVYFASGKDFPDALSISPVAARSGGVILYMPAKGEIDSASAAFAQSTGCSKAVIIGGTSAVSNEGEASVRKLGFSTERIGGANRYDTSTKICTRYAGLFGGDGIAVAAGTAFPDALAGGVFAAVRAMPVVLVNDPLPAEVSRYAASADPDVIYVFGGENAVSQNAADRLAQA